MKIKLAVLEKDINYLKRINDTFENRYTDNVHIFRFTDKEIALKSIEENKIDVLFAYEEFDIEEDEIPKRCGFAYLSDSNDKLEVKGYKSVGKYQNVDLIYKAVLNVYAEKGNDINLDNGNGDASKIICFTSPAGGVGKTSTAIACAKRMSATGKKVLYLDLDCLGDTRLFLSGEGQMDFGEIIFALKSQKGNLSIKLESNVKTDASGIDYFESCKVPLDIGELNKEDIAKLLTAIRMQGKYQYIIIDKCFELSDVFNVIIKDSNEIVLVSDGTDISNNKLVKVNSVIEILQDRDDTDIKRKVSVLYNKFSSKNGKVINGLELRDLGGIQRYEGAEHNQLIEEVARMDVFDKLL